jgi:hypothetical protein
VTPVLAVENPWVFQYDPGEWDACDVIDAVEACIGPEAALRCRVASSQAFRRARVAERWAAWRKGLLKRGIALSTDAGAAVTQAILDDQRRATLPFVREELISAGYDGIAYPNSCEASARCPAAGLVPCRLQPGPDPHSRGERGAAARRAACGSGPAREVQVGPDMDFGPSEDPVPDPRLLSSFGAPDWAFARMREHVACAPRTLVFRCLDGDLKDRVRPLTLFLDDAAAGCVEVRVGAGEAITILHDDDRDAPVSGTSRWRPGMPASRFAEIVAGRVTTTVRYQALRVDGSAPMEAVGLLRGNLTGARPG